MKRNNEKELQPDRIAALESGVFQLALVLLKGGFIVVGGLLGIIAALISVIAVLLK